MFYCRFSLPWICQNQHHSVDTDYQSKQFISETCTEIFEDILKKSYHLEEPLTKLPEKFCTETQTDEVEAGISLTPNNLKEIIEYDGRFR